MSYNAESLKEVAMYNKRDLKNKFFVISIKGVDYKFKVSGIGNRSIKIEKFFYYSEIIKSVAIGNTDGFEYEIKELIEESDSIGTANELREKALANKVNLKNEFIDIFIAKKFYEFRIAGIGFKSIKIEMYMGYDEIIKGLSSGNPERLEFILMELIIGEKLDFTEYETDANSTSKSKKTSKNEDVVEKVDVTEFNKISDDEFDDIIVNVKGWQKLVFDTIDDIIEDRFTLDLLLKQNRILSYQTRDEDLKDKVLENLNQLIELGLIAQVNKTTYYKLW